MYIKSHHSKVKDSANRRNTDSLGDEASSLAVTGSIPGGYDDLHTLLSPRFHLLILIAYITRE